MEFVRVFKIRILAAGLTKLKLNKSCLLLQTSSKLKKWYRDPMIGI